jgi:hypothetical protein
MITVSALDLSLWLLIAGMFGALAATLYNC